MDERSPAGCSPVDRFIDAIEVTAAGFLAVVTLLTFVSVFLRYLFSWSIPDAYDFTRLLLGILIFWGMAVASYRGDHITVDLLWSAAPPRGAARDRRVLGAGHAGRHGRLHLDVRREGARHPRRPCRHLRSAPAGLDLLCVAWIGLAAAVLLLVLRTLRLVFWPERLRAAR